MRIFITFFLSLALTACGSGTSENNASTSDANDNVLLAGMALPSINQIGNLINDQPDIAALADENTSGTITIDGESYPISDWNWSITQSGTTHMGKGGGGGKASISDLF